MYFFSKGRTFFSTLLVLTMVLAASVVAFGSTSSKFVPGTYTVKVPGFSGNLEVVVTVAKDEILKVEVASHTETPGIGTIPIEQLSASIVEQQTVKLDTIAGATVTSDALLLAVEEALRSAGASDAVIFAEPANVGSATIATETLATDVVIIGAGASGLAAALSAHQNGVENIIVLEKMPFVGGATSTAGGGMQAYRPDADPKVNEKNIEELFMYWNRSGKFTNNARLTMLAARLSAPTIDWLENDAGAALTYQINEEQPIVRYSSVGTAAAVINTLYAQVQDAGIPVLLNTRANHLIMDGDRVVGVTATGNKGQELDIRAQVVLLATGGYGNNPDLIPDSVQNVIYYGPVAPTGDGHIMAKEIGVPLFNMDKVATKHFGVETQPGFGIHIHWAVAQLFTKTGAFAVNKEGLRVVNEGGDELDIALASMHKSSDGRLYIVMDQESYDLFSSVLVQYKAFTPEQLETLIAENGSGITKLVKNDDLAEAAATLGLDVDAVLQTAQEFNQGVAVGKDAFGRTGIKEFGQGPYYIMQTVARFATSLGGVNVSDNLEVLDFNEQPVPGLFAAGEVVGNVHGSYAHYLIWCFAAGKHFGDVVPAFIQ